MRTGGGGGVAMGSGMPKSPMSSRLLLSLSFSNFLYFLCFFILIYTLLFKSASDEEKKPVHAYVKGVQRD